jgi:hypothetical protein
LHALIPKVESDAKTRDSATTLAAKLITEPRRSAKYQGLEASVRHSISVGDTSRASADSIRLPHLYTVAPDIVIASRRRMFRKHMQLP